MATGYDDLKAHLDQLERTSQEQLRAQPATRGSRVETTVEVSGGTSRQDPNEQKKLALIGRLAVRAGLGEEGARVAQAIAKTEGGLTGEVGDKKIGGSHGWYQFYAKGQLPQYAAAHGWTPAQAIAVIQSQPEHAAEWALKGYLGKAIKEGMAAGLRGGDLATYAQKNGQVSESPDRAGKIYGQMFSGPQKGTDQFNSELPTAVAWAACGPAAAVDFAKRFGRNPSMQEAVELAKQSGWTIEGGMNGVANQAALLEKMGVKSRLETNPDPKMIVHDASSGNPVIISTPHHYYFADAYDPKTGRLHVGVSGKNRKGGGEWMSVHEIARLDGGINGALFADAEGATASSMASRQDTGGRDDHRLSSSSAVRSAANDSPVLDESERAMLGMESGRLAREALGFNDENLAEVSRAKKSRQAFQQFVENPQPVPKIGDKRPTQATMQQPEDTPFRFDPTAQLDPTASLYDVSARKRERKTYQPLLG